MADMQQVDMQQAPAQDQAPQQGGGGVRELVAEAHDNLVELLGVLDSSNVASPEDKQVLANILQQYRTFVETSLAGGPKQQPPQPPGDNAPMEYVDQGSVLPA